jgi:uncharacterized protein (DUF1330 family)
LPAYVIVDIEVTDPDAYEDHKRLPPPNVAWHGRRYLVRGGATEVLEGSWSPNRLVVLEFATRADAKRWVDSADYRPARAIRQRSARSNMVVVEGAT